MKPFSARFVKVHLFVLAIYVLLALCLTYPLARQFDTHVPGDGIDAPPLAWNLWWVKHSLVELGRNPFDCDYLFYPIKINLAFYTLTVLNGVLSIPLQEIMGLVAANNVILLTSYVLGAYGTFLLVEHTLATTVFKKGNNITDLLRLYLAAFTGGFVYAFASSKMFFAALGQFNIASSQWIPFYILFLFKMRQTPQRVAPPMLAGLFLLLQTWAELTYSSFLILFTVLFFFYHLLSARRLQAMNSFLLGLLAVIVILVIGLSPILLMMLPDLATQGNFLMEGTGFAEEFSADLQGLFIPTQLHPLLGGWVNTMQFPHDKGQHLFLGWVTSLVALYGIARWGHWGVVRFWGVVGLGFLVLSLGPTPRINGTPFNLPLPFQVLQNLPFFQGNRYPGRIGVMVILALAILVAFGAWSILGWRLGTRVRPAIAGFAVIALIAFEHLSIPLPVVNLTAPEIYRIIGQDRTDATLLDIPIAWRNGFRVTGTMDPIIMFEQFYQTIHGKRILAGNTSRNPEYKFQYFTELPVIHHIIALETGHVLDPTVLRADAALAPDLLRFLNVRYILVHPAQSGPDVIPYIEATMPVERFYDRDGIVAYRVKPISGSDNCIDLGEPMAAARLGEGWGEAYVTDGYVWAQRDSAQLMAYLVGSPKTLSMRVWAPGPRQVVRMDVNGTPLAPIELAEGWGEYTLKLPADALKAGLNRFKLHFSRIFPVQDILPQGLPIGTSNICLPANLLVKSAGKEVGDFGHIYVNGVNVSPEGIGYNLIAMDPQKAQIIGRAAFNTFADESASVQMAEWVARLPTQTVVAVAVRDEASMRLGAEAVKALEALGLSGDLRDRFRWSHAAIGVKGFAPGQAIEMMEAIRPATVKVGLGVTLPQVAAAFDWLKFLPDSP